MVAVTSFFGLLVSAAALAAAAPAPLPIPSLEDGDLEKRTECTFSVYADAFKAKSTCSTITLDNIAMPAGQTLDMSGLKDGTKLIFSGTTTFGYKVWEGPLISVSGTNIHVTGTAGNVIDGGGARWWDTQGGNGGKTKPKFFKAHKLKTSTIESLNIKNSPVHIFSINTCTQLKVDGITIDNKDGDAGGLGHNTDAFNVGNSDGVHISNAHVDNQDDCIAINSGTDITFTGGYCSGGHGLSIGSVGGRSNNIVDGVVISDSVICNSDNGVRIKTVSGATGCVNNVTYSNIQLDNILKKGIVIQQDYLNGSPTGVPTTGVPITDITLKSVTGNSNDIAVYILCGKGSCSDWNWSDVHVTGKSYAGNLNVPAGVVF